MKHEIDFRTGLCKHCQEHIVQAIYAGRWPLCPKKEDVPRTTRN